MYIVSVVQTSHKEHAGKPAPPTTCAHTTRELRRGKLMVHVQLELRSRNRWEAETEITPYYLVQWDKLAQSKATL